MPLWSLADSGCLLSSPPTYPCSSVCPRPLAACSLSSSSKRLSSTSCVSSSSTPFHWGLEILGVRGAMWIAFNPEETAIGRAVGMSSSLLLSSLCFRSLGCFDEDLFRRADMQGGWEEERWKLGISVVTGRILSFRSRGQSRAHVSRRLQRGKANLTQRVLTYNSENDYLLCYYGCLRYLHSNHNLTINVGHFYGSRVHPAVPMFCGPYF